MFWEQFKIEILLSVVILEKVKKDAVCIAFYHHTWSYINKVSHIYAFIYHLVETLKITSMIKLIIIIHQLLQKDYLIREERTLNYTELY